MRTLVFFLEEASAREMLKGLLPRFLPPDVESRFVVFEGKQDLEKQLEKKLRGWQQPDSLFVVLRDQDAGDCRQVKAGLVKKCRKANRPHALVRIACHELESWYLGDLAAVERALDVKGLAAHQAGRKFRDPDSATNPSYLLRQATSNAYQKVSGSRAIGPELNLEGNRSKSFQVFISGLRRLLKVRGSQES